MRKIVQTVYVGDDYLTLAYYEQLQPVVLAKQKPSSNEMYT